ncbi:MAG: T9SS type A sorting domain-containing protein [Bacteroidales bacterium]|nr:T9SS type A sorting domain-containing protein [Bacteroidales bacterium]
MFVRQFYPDSIPIKMAVSVSPAAYLFPTDTFNSMFLGTPCGLGLNAMNYYGDCISGINDTVNLRFICDDHIFQYYNENYGVLVGEADSAYYSICVEQGDSRLERARNFFAFCDTNALSLGTTLKWQYAEVPGIGHNDSLMYHTCAAGDSIPIAERMLFETPWHPVPDSALVVDFEASTLRPKLSTGVVQFTNKTLNGVSYYWDFGDSTFSSQVNPQHTYLSPDTFSVKLTATSSTGCSYTLRKKYFIIVLEDTGIDENEPYATIKLFPNPAEYTLQFELPHTESVKFYISDITGRILQNGITDNEHIDISSLASGYYLLILQTENKWYRGRFVKE